MTSAAKYYPEFDSTEIAETITPLAAFDDEVAEVLRASRPAHVRDWIAAPEQYPFQRVVRSLAAAVADPDPVAGAAARPADPQAILGELLGRAEARIRDLTTRALVAAVNHARKHGRLAGTTPQDRYRDFVERSVATSFEAVSGLSFPVLPDLVRIVVRNERAAFAELTARLAADRAAIAEAFGIHPDDRLASLGRAEGDTHHHGRSVGVLVFESGARLVYKPRDVSCEAAYVTIARELNSRIRTDLATAAVLERPGYGYVEFVPTQDVAGRSEAFMRASGELAAVFYLLNARDMHFENILPTRRGPVPIDLETILHPERVHVGPTPEAPGNAYTTISQSVYGIGILPLVLAGKNPGSGHVDLGFLGDSGQGDSPFKAMQFDQPFTDEVRLVFRAAAAAERTTVVRALTEDETLTLGRCMADGFTRVFRAVMDDPDAWSALLRKAVAGIQVRYVHNPTALYVQTLRMTAGPRSLEGPEPYVALLKRIAIASKTSDRSIVRSELRQLAERDIPYFTVAGTGTDLLDGDGNPTGAHFAASPLDLALAKAARLSEFELGEQLRLIHSAFASRFPDNHLTPASAPAAPAGRSGGRTRDGMLELVTELADRLVATSLPDKFAHLPRTWIGPLASAEASRPWPPGVLGYELYTGRTGPALALAAAGRLLGEQSYRDLSAQIFSTTADILSGRRYEARSVAQAGYGGYTGLAGILFALSAAGRLLDEPGWRRAAQDTLPLLAGLIRDSAVRPPSDVIGGLSGVLSAVGAVGGPHAGALTAELTTLLVDGLADEDANRSLFAQSGFAHGVSGVLHALSRVYPALPDADRPAVATAMSALADRLGTFYDARESNWFSNVATPGTFSTGWCHGAAGIALALDAYARATGDGEAARRRELAVANTLREGFGRNLTWCHGDLGNHDVVSALAGPDDPALAAVEDRWLRPEVLLRKIDDPRSRYAHTNSLLVGSAGIVLHLTNRLDPDARTSVVDLGAEGR
ncbi:type 2 lanthipeptide synthetase LanM family protein [Actinoplanes sp. M2I2]|uniref:type 2 lanthipeptide synthetase LanM family protein n=1 Tax=Actinoplanes sp. M2I2 TaxID=1734444 RepID=UPI0020200D62|nr:type 2 lanthipeptide synthetase LanM family protein [Actinoplanes sp. M2I2]